MALQRPLTSAQTKQFKICPHWCRRGTTGLVSLTDGICHGKKAQFSRELSNIFIMFTEKTYLLERSSGFPNVIFSVQYDIMNVLYKPPIHPFQKRSISDCMFHSMVRKLIRLLLRKKGHEYNFYSFISTLKRWWEIDIKFPSKKDERHNANSVRHQYATSWTTTYRSVRLKILGNLWEGYICFLLRLVECSRSSEDNFNRSLSNFERNTGFSNEPWRVSLRRKNCIINSMKFKARYLKDK